MPKRTVKASPSDIDLNRWAIEMAMRWPIHTSGGYSANAAGAFARSETDADVIGRADKIIAWVKTKH